MGTILLLTMGIEKSSGKIEVLEALCFKDFLEAQRSGFDLERSRDRMSER